MKILKIIIGLVFLLFLLQCYRYVNLLVSEKYETDELRIELSELSAQEKKIEIEKIRIRAEEIRSEKERVMYYILGSFLFIILLLAYFFNRKKQLKKA